MKKQPIIFDQNPQDDFVDGEQTMDLLLHYAQSGIHEAERIMRDDPNLFSNDEIMDFAANKVVLAKAPDILSEYKKKVREFEEMHQKVQGVLSKCEKIAHNYDERQSGDDRVEHEEPGGGVIRYTEDGHIVMNTSSTGPKKRKKVVIELPKHNNY